MWKIIIGVIVAALLGAGGFMYYQSSQKKLATPPTETMVSPVPTEIPTPTPEPIDKTAYTIQILNGSGVAGKAGLVQTLVEDAGFTVDSTGNASSYEYEETEIQAGADVSPAFLQALSAVLMADYEVKSSVDEIAGTSESDVVIIVGKTDANGDSMVEATETPAADDLTATPTEEPTPTEAL